VKRKGLHHPTIEDLVELSGIETLHPGGMELTRRTAEAAGLRPDTRVLDVSSGRGTQAIFYAKEFGANVTGVDLSWEMVDSARQEAASAGLEKKVRFEQGDSQALLFPDNSFDVVINECAVGIPDDSQAVLNEMVRVARPGASIVIHESIWARKIDAPEKEDLAERYGTTPLEKEEWIAMLGRAGVQNIHSEFERWSRPETFWNVRKDKVIEHYSRVLAPAEKARTIARVLLRYGPTGVWKAFANERAFYRAVLQGKIGYCLFWGEKTYEKRQDNPEFANPD
jgi:SAM-dependent methyltransferase